MLSRLIVNVYGWIIEIWLLMALLISAAVGFNLTVPALKYTGAVLENELAWKILGAGAFPLISFLSLAVTFGPLLVLVDIRNRVKALEASGQAGSGNAGVLPIEYKEPHL